MTTRTTKMIWNKILWCKWHSIGTVIICNCVHGCAFVVWYIIIPLVPTWSYSLEDFTLLVTWCKIRRWHHIQQQYSPDTFHSDYRHYLASSRFTFSHACKSFIYIKIHWYLGASLHLALLESCQMRSQKLNIITDDCLYHWRHRMYN